MNLTDKISAFVQSRPGIAIIAVILTVILMTLFSEDDNGHLMPADEAMLDHVPQMSRVSHAHHSDPLKPKAQAEAEVWSCSMHPHIQRDKPGQCPICGMDLIPVPQHETQNIAGMDGMDAARKISVSPAQKALMRIETFPVERRFPIASLRLVGKVAYDETNLASITAWIPGRIDGLFVDYTGLKVQKGDHMVRLYSPELYSAQEELLQAIRGMAEISKSGLSSLQASAEGTVAASRDKLRRWGLTAEQIKAIEKSGKPTEHVTIYSPASGVVIHKNAQEGMYVETGSRIFTIADLSSVWVQLDAYESDLQWLHYGQPVAFTTEAFPGETFEGRVAFIDPVLNPKTRTAKVRVNVDNSDQRLKPEMFVRANVSARLANDGKVVDEMLAGKWVSPMHPEIIRNTPGQCPVCGMELVTAESLGFTQIVAADLSAPLVIPATAALLTGNRAIVYIEVPDTDRPTYVGREVVLGPRAGEDYVVKSGLKVGDLVVVSGNFKIDSALQIQAKPSMMNPEGGGATGGHNH
ncbi:efflux RND transporter periplasmic adaptor subunit [Reinekea sp.]|uniref:efflux RND transporter periplasmic adaptor subunit n=1 Tax=Reinekea sp. TaxID=1970455 RepID=UPI00257FFE0D|nr:efflux RND transporter periplasmic adaptor subunit [Reinekea sp.]